MAVSWKGAKEIPTKGIRRNSLKVKRHGEVWVLSGCLQTLSGNFQGVFPYPLRGIPFAGIPLDPSKFLEVFSRVPHENSRKNQEAVCSLVGDAPERLA